MAECLPVLDDLRVYMTFVVFVIVLAAILLMVNLVKTQDKPDA